MSQYRAYFVPGGVDPWGLCVADQRPLGIIIGSPKRTNSSRKAFNDKCGPFLELIYHTYSSFHDLFTTRYTPGWGEYSIHKWIEYDHPKGEYGVEFDKILRDSKNCCEALKEIRKLIYDYHRLGEYGPSFVGPIKVPLHRYRNANHSTGDLLDKFIDIACNQPPNLPPLTRRVPEPVLIPRRVPPITIPRVVPPSFGPLPPGSVHPPGIPPGPVHPPGFIVPDVSQEAQAAAAGVSTAVVLYWIISEGSRLFPPRNLLPIP